MRPAIQPLSPMRLFHDGARSNSGPALFSEGDYEFLDRVADAHWDRVRRLLEEWFAAHPATEKPDVYKRFTDFDVGQHIGAWWEIYVASLYRHLGYTVVAHPTIEGSDRKPDFLISRAGSHFYVECTVALPGDSAKGAFEWIVDCISDIETRDFLVGIRHIKHGSQRPRRIEVTRPLTQWLEELDADALLQHPEEELPSKEIPIRDWTLTCVALPTRPDGRHSGGRNLGYLPPVTNFPSNDVDRLHETITKKGRRYGREPLQHPFIVAVLATFGFLDQDDVGEALFGRKEFQWYTGDPDSVTVVRKRNGYWRGDWSTDDAQRGARVSAVLFGSNLRYWRVAQDLPDLWINPWAAVPLTDLDGFTTITVAAEPSAEIVRTDGSLTAAEVFALDPNWPWFPDRWS